MAERLQVLRAHILPLTNCAFNKSGDRFITGSYDRTCKVCDPLHALDHAAAAVPCDDACEVVNSLQVWDSATGEEVHTLEGHKNVVSAV